MRAFTLFLASAFCVFVQTAPHAQMTTQPRNANRLIEANDLLRERGESIDHRRTASDLINKYCAGYLRAIPELSPREIDWMNNEVRALRLVPLIVSPENERSEAIKWLKDCSSMTDAITNQQFTAGNEFYYWSLLASLFLETVRSGQLERTLNRIHFPDDVSALIEFAHPNLSRLIVPIISRHLMN